MENNTAVEVKTVQLSKDTFSYKQVGHRVWISLAALSALFRDEIPLDRLMAFLDEDMTDAERPMFLQQLRQIRSLTEVTALMVITSPKKFTVIWEE